MSSVLKCFSNVLNKLLSIKNIIQIFRIVIFCVTIFLCFKILLNCFKPARRIAKCYSTILNNFASFSVSHRLETSHHCFKRFNLVPKYYSNISNDFTLSRKAFTQFWSKLSRLKILFHFFQITHLVSKRYATILNDSVRTVALLFHMIFLCF